MAVEVQEKSIFKGVGYMIFAVGALVGLLIFMWLCFKIYKFYNFLKSLLNIARQIPNIHPQSQQNVQDAREQMNTRPPRQVDPSSSCPICLGPITYGVETNCGHIFCGRCIISYWKTGRWQQGFMACPICRRKVRTLMLSFTTTELRQERSEMKNEILDEINRFNGHFAGQSRNILDYFRDMPALLRHAASDFFSLDRMDMVARIRIFLSAVLALVYFISPLDLVPEAVVGFLGYIDDAFILSMVSGHISSIYRSFLQRQAEQQARQR